MKKSMFDGTCYKCEKPVYALIDIGIGSIKVCRDHISNYGIINHNSDKE